MIARGNFRESGDICVIGYHRITEHLCAFGDGGVTADTGAAMDVGAAVDKRLTCDGRLTLYAGAAA